jgi:hypothetical protein
VNQRSGLYPRLDVDAAGSRLVSQAGGALLVDTIRVAVSARCCRRRWRSGGNRTRCTIRQRWSWIW